MDTLFPRCAGIDVPKANVVVCIRVSDRPGKVFEEVRTFQTMTRDLLALSDWLAEHGVTHVAMESTGVYWKPVFNILEGRCQVILVNAEHIKQVPGRKTDGVRVQEEIKIKMKTRIRKRIRSKMKSKSRIAGACSSSS